MGKYLFKCSINYTWKWIYNHPKTAKTPVYVVSSSKEEAKKYVDGILKDDCTVKSVTKLASQLSGILFHGKE